MDATTQAWVRNKSDAKAAANGCRFLESRGQFVCNWVETNAHLYEGSRNLIKLMPWQRDFIMRLFGWIKWGTNLPSGGQDRWIRRFRVASLFVPKKSGKSPLAAAIALYLLCADGEQGNHIFFAAADGGQAGIMAKHAIQMVKASPELDADQGGEIRINLSTKTLTHMATISDARPISSSDKKAAQAKQGLNGSVIIDEVHVLTRSFVSESSIDQAGIARDEPLHIEVSTAGKNPDEYGKGQYEYGKLVESGEQDDQAFLFVAYEAPQQLTDDELAADPVKFGRMANPSWGFVVQEQEYLAHYHRAKRSIADLADFKTFRLNIWQQTEHPFILMSDWRACRKEFSESDLAGMTCPCGMDLSLKWDMTAFVLCFPLDNERYRILPYFFLPRVGFEKLVVTQPQLLEWERDGFITVTPGSDLDYNFIRDTIAAKHDLFRIETLIYDPKFANHITQQIEEELGIERQEFAQAMGKFAEPTATFEKLVINGKLEHNGNPCMDWQVGHTNVETDKNGYMRPVKPKREDARKVDGVVASIMALAGGMQIGSADAWYTPGMFLRS